MKKKCLFFIIALTAGAIFSSSYAQGVDPENIKSYEDLKQVVANIKNAPNLKKAYDDAVVYEEVLRNNKPAETIEVTTEKDVTWTSPLVTHIINFQKSKDAANLSGIIEPNTLSYRIRVKKADRSSDPEFYLYVTFPEFASSVDNQMSKEDVEGTSKFNKWKDDKWTTTDMEFLKECLDDEDAELPYSLKRTEGDITNATPSQMIVCYEKYTKNANGISKDYATIPFEAPTKNGNYFYQNGWMDKLATLAATPSLYGLEVTYTESNTTTEPNTAALEKWETDCKNAATATQTAKSKWDAINKGDFYLNASNVFKITENFEIPTTKADLTWPEGRTLDGNCSMITGNVPLISINYGDITNLISPNGRLIDRNVNLGRALGCIAKQSDTDWRIYDNDGYVSYETLKAAVYKLRDKFGYDIERDKATGAATRTTKLYEAKYADATHKDLYTFHVNLGESDGENAFVYNKGQAATDNRLTTGIKRENTVIYINNADVPGDVKGWPNVAVRNSVGNEKYTCKNVKLVDGMRIDESGKEVETEDFYVHTGFAFETINYERSFTQNMTAICLPFKLDDNIKTVLQEKTGTNIWYYTFKEVKGKTLWFNVVKEVEANTPCIIAYDGEPKDEVVFNEFTVGGSVLPEFASTNGATLGATASNSGDLCFFGNYKAGQHANELAAINNGGKGACIYGFQDGELRLLPEATEGTDGKLHGPRLHQFRSYIRLEADLTSPGATPSSFNIGFLDEDGNEVTAIETVSSRAGNGFKAVGGNGAIEISADKACEVKVYTASGALAKTVRVEAGNTTLPFSAGMYIVNQTKVVVK